MLLWQVAFHQVFYERASPILRGKHGIALFPVHNQVVDFALGLGQVCVLAHAWPIETHFLEPSV